MSNLIHRVETAQASAKVISAGFTQIAPRAEWLSGFASGGVVVWVASALAVVAMGFVLTRVIEEL